jgi:hypothetical protein
MSKSLANGRRGVKIAEKGHPVDPTGSASAERTDEQVVTPLYFRGLFVKNIASFGDETQLLNLSSNGSWSPWTIILGGNGAGKSTLLQVLACTRLQRIPDDRRTTRDDSAPQASHALSVWPNPNLVRMSSRSVSFHPFDLRMGFRAFEQAMGSLEDRWEQLNTDEAGGLEVIDILRGCQHWSTTVVDVQFSCQDSKRLLLHNTDAGKLRNSNRHLLREDNPAARLELPVFGFGAWRRPGRGALADSPERSAVAHLFDDSVELVDAEDWFLQAELARLATAEQDSRSQSTKRAVRIRDLVKRSLLQLLGPDVSDIRVQVDEDSTKPRVVFRTATGEVLFPQLGYGYRSMTTWVVDFAAGLFRLYPDSENPLSEPAVCLVDEIDLHLHPSWQRRIMGHLSKLFPKTQFIATAHSPLVVQSAPEVKANVVVLKPQGDHVVIDNNPISVDGRRVDQILNSELFGEQPLRNGKFEELRREQDMLLAKPRPSKKDRARLDELERELADLPVGASQSDIDLNNRLRKIVEGLEQRAGGAK